MPKKVLQPKMVFSSKEEKYSHFRELKKSGISDIEVGRLTGYAKSSVSHALHEKTRKKKAQYQYKDRLEMINYYNSLKTLKGCIDCGYNSNPEVLDWDHIPSLGKKLFKIADGIRNKTKKQVKDEIAKCEVRCSNCHRNITQLRKLELGKTTQIAFSFELLENYRFNIREKIKNTGYFIPGKVRQYIFDYIALTKESKPCMDCNKSYPFFIMDYDHVFGEKYDNLSKLYKRVTLNTLDLIDIEIAKCDLVCSNCHRVRTNNRRELTVKL